jgi:hypothetical protein
LVANSDVLDADAHSNVVGHFGADAVADADVRAFIRAADVGLVEDNFTVRQGAVVAGEGVAEAQGNKGRQSFPRQSGAEVESEGDEPCSAAFAEAEFCADDDVLGDVPSQAHRGVGEEVANLTAIQPIQADERVTVDLDSKGDATGFENAGCAVLLRLVVGACADLRDAVDFRFGEGEDLECFRFELDFGVVRLGHDAAFDGLAVFEVDAVVGVGLRFCGGCGCEEEYDRDRAEDLRLHGLLGVLVLGSSGD